MSCFRFFAHAAVQAHDIGTALVHGARDAIRNRHGESGEVVIEVSGHLVVKGGERDGVLFGGGGDRVRHVTVITGGRGGGGGGRRGSRSRRLLRRDRGRRRISRRRGRSDRSARRGGHRVRRRVFRGAVAVDDRRRSARPLDVVSRGHRVRRTSGRSGGRVGGRPVRRRGAAVSAAEIETGRLATDRFGGRRRRRR